MTKRINRAVIASDIKEAALQEFVETWTSYASASRAATTIATRHGIGRTTLVDWARDAGQWPRTRASVAAQLEQENEKLRAEIAKLRDLQK